MAARREAVLREMVELLTGAARYDARTIHRLAELRAHAVTLRQAGGEAARAALTPEQWPKLPEALGTLSNSFSFFPPQVITGETF